MKFKSLLFIVGFIPAMVLAQQKLATPSPIEKPVAVNPPSKPATLPNSANLATKPPAPQNPPMSGYQATHGGNMGAAPQQQPQKPLVSAPQKKVGSIPPHNIGDH